MVAGDQGTLSYCLRTRCTESRGVPVNDDLCHDIVLFSATFNDFYLLQRYPQVFSTKVTKIKSKKKIRGQQKSR